MAVETQWRVTISTGGATRHMEAVDEKEAREWFANARNLFPSLASNASTVVVTISSRVITPWQPVDERTWVRRERGGEGGQSSGRESRPGAELVYGGEASPQEGPGPVG